MPKELETSLKLSEEVQEINHNAIGLLDNFHTENIDLSYICEQFNAGNYSVLPITIANGKVFKISIKGSLDIDGYEEGLLYITTGSGIKEHKHTNDVERYTLLMGELIINGTKKDVDKCLIGKKHSIDNVSKTTIIRTLKISRKFIVENSSSYSPEEVAEKSKIFN